MPTEAEQIATRIARMKALLADLEKETTISVEARTHIQKLKAELDAARQSLKRID